MKWKESVAEAVRRIGREQCDTLLLAAEEPAGVEATDSPGVRYADEVSRNVRRALSLLAVVGPVMDREALRRERNALRRAARQCQPQALQTRPTASVATVNGLLQEVRMRAGYWHLNADGFDALRPGLMRVYAAARRHVLASAAAGACEKPQTARDALAAWADAIKLVERAWPELLKSERKRVRGLIEVLDGDSPESKEHAALWRESAAWMSETPGRWCDRVGGYWRAWREEERRSTGSE